MNAAAYAMRRAGGKRRCRWTRIVRHSTRLFVSRIAAAAASERRCDVWRGAHVNTRKDAVRKMRTRARASTLPLGL